MVKIQPLTPRRIGSPWDVKTVAQRLSYYAYAETRLLEAQAGWLVTIPQIELKIELSYQLFEDACHVNDLRQRLPELGLFGDDKVRPVNEAFERFCNELTNTPDLLERLVGVFWVLRPHLLQVYAHHLEQADSVSDNPTARLLQRAYDDHRRFTTWGDKLIRELAQETRQTEQALAWRDHLLALLENAGGVIGENLRLIRPVQARNDAAPLRFRAETPVRDERFRIEPYERREGRAAFDVWNQERFVKYMFMNVEGEVEATEACGQTLYDYPEAPWELRFLIARQLWDEARHAELSLQRFLELGGTFDLLPVRDHFPLYFGPVRNTDLAKRLAHLNQVIEGWVTDEFAMMADNCRQMNDERSARLFEQLIADEWLHIKIGADWIPKLTADSPEHRAEVLDYRLQFERKHYADLDRAALEIAARFSKETQP
jgi:uncharacterized ferritin-like protein (DUF455 family)